MKPILSKLLSHEHFRLNKIVFFLLIAGTAIACSDRQGESVKDHSGPEGKPVPQIIEKYSGHSPNGFIGNRRLRPGNYMQFDVLATTRNFINIWIPELCSYKGLEKPFFLLSEGVNQLKLDTTSTGGISLSSHAGNLELTGTAEEFKYGLYLTVNYHNTSKKTLEDVSSSVCIQLTAAPDFRDPLLSRTFWYNDGKWDNTFKIDTVVQEGIMRCKFYRSQITGENSLPLVVVDAPDSNYAIGLIFRDATSISGNFQMSTGCMHADGGTVDIKPGGYAAREGLLIIHPDGKEAVLKIAREFYNAKDL